MAKFLCVCGQQIRTSGAIPNPDEWRVLSDVEFDEFIGMIDAEVIYRRTTIMYRCPHSGHLWFFWNGFDARPTIYEPLGEAPW
ncbi:MAG TPA: hypothetical protein VFQ85_08945 [Mycobacteriales bacterium]|nr:hypothetical protein [Mycobacteriales bacterium]